MTKQRGPDGRFVKAEGKAITAAASVIPTRAIENMPRSPEGWQTRAWRLWRLLGVVHFPTSFKAKQVGSLGWNIEVNGEQLDEDEAAEALEAITAPLGTAEAARRIALNLEVAGQVFYARAKDDWRVYAATMPKLKEMLKEADIIVEGIQPDPEEPGRPTSSIQAALGTAEAIRLMAQMSRAQDRSRLAQRGILLKPSESQFPEGDDFQANLEEAMTAPIADEYAPSAVVPLVVTQRGEDIEKWRLLEMTSAYDDKLMDRIEASVKQFAREIDMPPEVLLGNLDSNHWNAWLSSEENYRGHVQPLGILVGQVFAEALMEATGVTEFAGSLIRVLPDPSSMLAHRPTVEDAFKALDMLAVGYDFVRRAIGADEEDAPTDEEIERILLAKGLAQPQSATEEEPTTAPDPEADPAIPGPIGNGNGAVAASVDDSDAELDELAHRLSDIDFRLLSVLEGQTSMAVGATMGLDPDAVDTSEVIEREVERLGRSWSREVTQARKVLSSLGIDAKGPEWDEAQALSVEVLTDGVTEYVTANLGKTESQMPALPTPLLRQVLATAGGSSTATVAAIVRNPAPTFSDPQGFAIGVLPLKQLRKQDVQIVQWRFRYGPMTRALPFEPHVHSNGQFMTADGITGEGYYPGDHKGCECSSMPVFRKTGTKEAVA